MERERQADLILTNALVLTMEPAMPTAEFVAVKGGKILGVGDVTAASQFIGPGTRQMDCQGMTLLPGFIDAHCHLMALASSLRAVDCRPDRTSSISQIVEAVRGRAKKVPRGSWVRAFGYDEFYLAEKRHPKRWDLDRASPSYPVRLDHRTGHASVLNSRALEILNITKHSPDPVDGVIEREEAGGEPTGLLYEMGDYLRRGMAAHRDSEATLEGMRMANSLLLSMGITSLQDASPGNDLPRWRTFQMLKAGGWLTPRVMAMAGACHLQSFLDEGLTPGFGDHDLTLGAVKVMLTLTTGALLPNREELQRLVLDADRKGFQIAIHAVEEQSVEAAADALLCAQAALPMPHRRHRIEHCSECPPQVLDKVAGCQAMVVTQPSFVFHTGDRYLALSEQALLPHLYPLASFAKAGIAVAAGSDAPVTPPDPLVGIYAAVTRRTKGGFQFYPEQAISPESALRMHTIGAAHASFEEGIKGTIKEGKLADLVLLDQDPTAVEPEAIQRIRVVMTLVGGEVVWQR